MIIEDHKSYLERIAWARAFAYALDKFHLRFTFPSSNFDTFLYEECQKDNGHEWGKRFVVFTENSIIDLEDIYELAKFTEGLK